MPYRDKSKARENQRERSRRYRERHPEDGKARTKKYYDENAELIRAKALVYYYENKQKTLDRLRRSHLMSRYGLTPEQFDALGDSCSICGLVKHENGYRLHVDHDHKSGTVRGKLCHGCNTGLGAFKHDTDLLRAAIAYLEQFTGV